MGTIKTPDILKMREQETIYSVLSSLVRLNKQHGFSKLLGQNPEFLLYNEP